MSNVEANTDRQPDSRVGGLATFQQDATKFSSIHTNIVRPLQPGNDLPLSEFYDAIANREPARQRQTRDIRRQLIKRKNGCRVEIAWLGNPFAAQTPSTTIL